MFAFNHTADGGIELSGALTIHHLEALFAGLQSEKQAQRAAYVFNLSKVEDIDTPATQLLMAFKRSMGGGGNGGSGGCRVRFEACPEEVAAFLAAIQLDRYLLGEENNDTGDSNYR